MPARQRTDLTRRSFLGGLGGGALWLRAPGGAGPGGKPLRGIFPIAQTPFTAAGELDPEGLIAELRFLHRGGVHGFVWPQLASEWSVLSEAERLAAGEALAAEARKLRPALVLVLCLINRLIFGGECSIL